MQERPQTCPLCDSGSAKCTHHTSRRVWQVACPACGEFEMTYQGEEAVRYGPAKALRHAHSFLPRLDRGSVIGLPILNKCYYLRSYSEGFEGLSVAAKVRTLLEILRKHSEFFGNLVEFFTTVTDWPLLVANGPEEGQAILQHARSRNLVAQGDGEKLWTLTWDGWQAVEPLAGGIDGLGFVAMAFRPELEDAFQNGILPALDDCGFRAIRVDKEHFRGKDQPIELLSTSGAPSL